MNFADLDRPRPHLHAGPGLLLPDLDPRGRGRPDGQEPHPIPRRTSDAGGARPRRRRRGHRHPAWPAPRCWPSWCRARWPPWPARCSAPTSSSSHPSDFRLFVSLQYIAMIVVGGVGTTFGPILGALFITTMPRVIEEFSDRIPGVATRARGQGHHRLLVEPGPLRRPDHRLPAPRTPRARRACGCGSRRTSGPGRSRTDASDTAKGNPDHGTDERQANWCSRRCWPARPRSSRRAAVAATARARPTAAAAADHGTGRQPGVGASRARTRRAAPTKELTPGAGFDGKTIKVGDITALSGAAAVIGTQLAAGQDVFWKYYNAENGGIAGKYPGRGRARGLALRRRTTTVQKYNKIKNDVVMFSQVMGTAPTLALLPLLNADNVVAAPASQDAFWVREQHLFPIIEPYQIDAINAMDYMMNEGGGAGQEGLRRHPERRLRRGRSRRPAVRRRPDGLRARGHRPRYKLGDQDFTAQVNELQERELRDRVRRGARRPSSARSSAPPPRWASPRSGSASRRHGSTLLLGTPLKDYLASNVMIAAVGPEWGDPDVPAAVEFAERVKTVQARPEARTTTSRSATTRRRPPRSCSRRPCQLGSLDRDGIVTAMNSLDKLTVRRPGRRLHLRDPPTSATRPGSRRCSR